MIRLIGTMARKWPMDSPASESLTHEMVQATNAFCVRFEVTWTRITSGRCTLPRATQTAEAPCARQEANMFAAVCGAAPARDAASAGPAEHVAMASKIVASATSLRMRLLGTKG